MSVRVMLFNASNTRKLHQRTRRRHCPRLLIQSLQEGGMGRVCVCTAGTSKFDDAWRRGHSKKFFQRRSRLDI